MKARFSTNRLRDFWCGFLGLMLLGNLAVAAMAVAGTAAEAKSVKIPDVWRAPPAGLFDADGWAWFRCLVKIPAEWKNEPLTLFSEPVDDARELFLNGRSLGRSGEFPPQYRSGLGGESRFRAAGDAVQPGAWNLVAVRVRDARGRRGFQVAAPVVFGPSGAIRLAGDWQAVPGDDPQFAQRPTGEALAAVPRYERVEDTAEVERTLRKLPGEEGPLAPAESLARFQAPADLAVELVLSEPTIGQPLSMQFDERGRLWLVQYLQYPNPAGLKMLSRDTFLRAVYDKVPPPPPNHFRGADKVTIHEDTDGDGRFDRHGTFVEGLNLCTAAVPGRGGVWVLNPPYLLCYPDADRDDRPDGDPVVHLEGFGLEDSHSLANSLCWGPDGWLYAGQGSTVSADIRRPGLDKQPLHSAGQLIWRYHPESRRYEIFAEGGGNTFGVEIDARGRLFSGHNGGDTRGFHYVQGGAYRKGFGKHGPLSNPYAFGFFEQMAHAKVPRFTHQFVIYEADALPAAYQGRLFAVAPLQSQVLTSELLPDRSSWQTRDTGPALTTSDTWFRPVQVQVGPDGAVYVADFYEQRIDHASHYQGRVDTGSGRVYRLRAKTPPPVERFDLAKASLPELFARLRHANKWQRQMALRVLADRRDPAGAPLALALLEREQGLPALHGLWALNACGGLDETQARNLLGHAEPEVRLWTARLLGDARQATPALAEALADLARREPRVEVRSQLAATARRLPTEACLGIVRQLALAHDDSADIHLPLLVWWAIESQAGAQREAVISFFADAALWSRPLVREHLAERVMRRFAAAGTRADLMACARLLAQAPSAEDAHRLMVGFEAAYEGRPLLGLPDELLAAVAKAGGVSLALEVRQGDAAAIEKALALAADEQAKRAQRLQFVQILGQTRPAAALPRLLALAETTKDDEVRAAALHAVQGFADPRVPATLTKLHDRLSENSRLVAQSTLASRADWTLAWLAEIAAGRANKELVGEPIVRKMLLHPLPEIDQRIQRIWGPVQGATTAEMRAEVERFAQLIQAGTGSPYLGKVLFSNHCGKCHTLFGEGGRIGPDLTSYKRDDLRGMLLHVVNPSAEIREGFENMLAVTSDGRALSGLMVEQDPQIVVLRGIDGQTSVLRRDELDELRATPRSLMPEGALKSLGEQQVRDLFAYLRATQPLP